MAADPIGEQLLVRKDGSTISAADAFADKKYILFYFSASWCPPCRAFTPVLSEWYTAHHADADKESTVVFVSADRDEASFKEYFGHMSFDLALEPETQANEKLNELFAIDGFPTLVVVDAFTGEVITKDGREGVTGSPDGLPWVLSLTEALSSVDDYSAAPDTDATVTWAELQEVEMLGLYFSASWCDACRKYTPTLIPWYAERAVLVADKKLELVFVSSDEDELAFMEYRAEMPWKALPFSRRDVKYALSRALNVEGIPSLVFINPRTGEIRGKM